MTAVRFPKPEVVITQWWLEISLLIKKFGNLNILTF